jgi:hypothetical protein
VTGKRLVGGIRERCLTDIALFLGLGNGAVVLAMQAGVGDRGVFPADPGQDECLTVVGWTLFILFLVYSHDNNVLGENPPLLRLTINSGGQVISNVVVNLHRKLILTFNLESGKILMT